ncbi:type VI secretion system-associated protein TagF [Pseudomonas alliivorans]|nr:type VI secretion system-associated protein TagF [Pseudomonas alliivorans]MEE4677894.1 type VI secretion system-associated protein TagF [Pseudomonas alliivorans]MEE4703971.1 type VI secretion system-associated protein TagF [Pseudomonas alliivorans]MEE4739944.1 type VI secretion system-associated protein TagF [Pseudomonas alliivorans]
MIGCFGKVPASTDFVSLNGAMSEVCEFDLWLQNGLGRMQVRDDWRELFDELPVCFFSYRSRTGQWLLGGFISSRDASGRRYPFMVFQSVKADQELFFSPHTLCELFAGQIKPLLMQAAQGADIEQIFARIRAMRSWTSQDLDLYRRVHEKFLADFNLRDVARPLRHSYPEFNTQSGLESLYRLRKALRNQAPQAISLPLPAESGLKRPMADMWCTLLSRLRGKSGMPDVSVLVDSFMRPGLLCFPSRGSDEIYRILTGISSIADRYNLLDPSPEPQSAAALALPDDHLALNDFIERFVSARDEPY